MHEVLMSGAMQGLREYISNVLASVDIGSVEGFSFDKIAKEVEGDVDVFGACVEFGAVCDCDSPLVRVVGENCRSSLVAATPVSNHSGSTI